MAEQYDESGRPQYIDSVENGTHTWRKVRSDAEVNVDTTVAELVNSYSDSYDMPSGKEPQAVTNPYSLDKTGPGISGKVNTEVVLTSVTKTPAPDTGKGYGAQLYTLGQMNRYIDTTNPAMQAVLENGKLSDEYVYTCWSVNTKGTCTQPWTLLFEEEPLKSHLVEVTEGLTTPISDERFIDKEGKQWAYEVDENGDIKYTAVTGAKVLGVTTIRPNGSFHYDSKIKSGSSDISKMYNYVSADILSEDNPNGYSDFWYAADSNADMRNAFGLSDVANDKKFNVGYYVVVAYPKDQLDTYTAEEYGADSWYSNKYVDGDDKEGVLTVLDELKKTSTPGNENYNPDTQQYLGNIVFHEGYSAGYYNTCHKTKDDYSYEDGKYYQIVNVDDIMTAMPYGYMTEGDTLKEVYGKPFILGGDDYFYSRAVLTISEQDIDPFEDEKLKLTGSLVDEYKAIDSDLRTRNVENGLDWVVFGWFNGESDWREINMSQYRTEAVKEKLSAVDADNPHITMNEYIACMGKDGKYKLTMNFLDKDGESGCPFRVKIVHNSIAYDSDATFVLTTQLKVNSPQLSSEARHENLFYCSPN